MGGKKWDLHKCIVSTEKPPLEKGKKDVDAWIKRSSELSTENSQAENRSFFGERVHNSKFPTLGNKRIKIQVSNGELSFATGFEFPKLTWLYHERTGHIEALLYKILQADFRQVSRHKRKTNKERIVLRSNNRQIPPIGAPWVILRIKDHSVTNSKVPEISGFTGCCWNGEDPRKTRAHVLTVLL